MGKFVLDKDEMVEYLKSNDITLMRADMTEEFADATALLTLLGRKDGSLPFLAVFPADRTSEAHSLQDYNPFNSEPYRVKLRRIVKNIPNPPEETRAVASRG